ncbi:MAG: LysE family translocator [Flavobacteriaceae bacterium]|nr:LysE family translocator [Flavobacteriaceae bacterium]
MELNVLISFLILAISLTLMPGPDIIYVLTESLQKGKKTGLVISTGLCLGLLVHTTIVITGVAVFVRDSEWLFDIIKITGAIYIGYLCYKSFFENNNTSLNTESTTNIRSIKHNIIKGFTMNVLNPKVTIFFMAFFPNFIDYKSEMSSEYQILILAAIFIVQAFIIFGFVVLMVSKLSDMFRSDMFWTVTKWFKTVVLALLCVYILIF